MAIKAQGTLLKVETSRAATKAITSATAANPVVISAAAHGYSAGDIVAIDNIVGMTQLNKRVFVVANPLSGSFELKGEDGTSYTAYASGGDSYKLTMSTVGQVTNFDRPGAAADEIDVTHLQSVSKEKLIGLPDYGDATFDLWLDNADAGQAALRTAQKSQSAKGFTVTATDTKVACMSAFVKQMGFSMPTNGACSGKVTLTFQSQESFFA